MASRRSRLQIKPNIGGPKLPGAKPSVKREDPKPVKGDNSAAPAKVTSPRKIVGSSSGPAQKSSESPKKNVGAISPLVTRLNKSPRKSGDINEREDKIIQKTENHIKQTANEESGNVDPNASINRFTKLIPKVVKDETVKSNITETITQDSGNDKTKQADTENGGISKKMEEHQEVLLKEEQQANMAKSTTLPRRSRFPKAKPNVIDASKKRLKNSTVQESRSPAKSSAVTIERIESHLKRKATDEVKIVNEDEIITEKTIEVVDGGLVTEPEAPGTPQPFIPPISPVKTPSAPFHHLRSMLGTPISTLSPTASPAKDAHGSATRTRTLSTSEAPVIKKPRRTKIDIPTDKPPDRATMRMRDLIHWNPSSNPMKVKPKPDVKISTAMEEKENKKDKSKTNPTQNKTTENAKENETSSQAIDVEDETDTAMPVPQVTIGPDGNIVINEKSLVVENENLDKSLCQDDEVIDETDHMTTYSSFRDSKRAKRWSKKETTKFYKALAMIGADFFLIQKVFPKRSRAEIKRKFKREEKQNSHLVEMVLKEGIHFDRSFIENVENEESSDEEAEKVKQKEKRKEKPKVEKEKVEKKTKGRKPKSQFKQTTLAESFYDKMSDEETEQVDDTPQIVNSKDDVDWEPPTNTSITVNNTFNFRKPLQRKAKHAATDSDILYATPVDIESLPEPKVIKFPIINRLAKANISGNNTNLPELNPNVSYADSSAGESMELNDSGCYSNEMSLSNDSSNVELLSVPILTEPTTIPDIQNSSDSQNMTTLNSPENQQTIENTIASSQTLPMISVMNNSAGNDNVPLMIPPQELMQFQTGPDSADQYVLVTVVPEGSEETVIHIYKVPSGAASDQFSNDT